MKKAIIPAIALFFIPAAPPVQAQVAGFSDVPSTHWAADSVRRLVELGILAGPKQPKQQKSAPKPTYNGDKPVTRYELAVTLHRFVQYIERADNQPKSKMGAQADPTGPQAVQKLIAGGYLPKATPLAQEGDKLVTANELGDAIAAVIAKAREKRVPISPDSKYAPVERIPGGTR